MKPIFREIQKRSYWKPRTFFWKTHLVKPYFLLEFRFIFKTLSNNYHINFDKKCEKDSLDYFLRKILHLRCFIGPYLHLWKFQVTKNGSFSIIVLRFAIWNSSTNQTLRKICQNTGFLWPLFSRTRTEWSTLSYYEKMWVREDLHSDSGKWNSHYIITDNSKIISNLLYYFCIHDRRKSTNFLIN